MYVISLDLRVFAIKADKQLVKNGADKPGQTLEKAAECLMGLFRVCAADKYTISFNSMKIEKHILSILSKTTFLLQPFF